MLRFLTPVKFKGIHTFSGISKKTGQPFTMRSAKLFITEFGTVHVPITGEPKFPALDTIIDISLTVDQGSFKSLVVVWDESTVYKAV